MPDVTHPNEYPPGSGYGGSQYGAQPGYGQPDQAGSPSYGGTQYGGGQYGAPQPGGSQYGGSQGTQYPPAQPYGTQGSDAPPPPYGGAPGQAGFGAPPPKKKTNIGAIIGGVIGAIVVLVVIGGLVVRTLSAADRDNETGEITEGGNIAADSLQIGDCIEELLDGVPVTELPAVPCSEPHIGEVYAKFDLADGPFPGEETVAQQGETGCVDRLASFPQEILDDPGLEIFYLQPTQRSWELGDREIVCLTFYNDGPRTGSISD